MTAKKENKIPRDKLELYNKLVATNQNIERKGDTVPYTSLNGHMFSYLSSTGTLALRLPEKERDTFLKKYHTTLMGAYGVIQREYVTVPSELLKNTKELKKYFDLSYEYVRALKPKAARKAKAVKKK